MRVALVQLCSGDDPATTALTYSIVPAEPVVSPTG